MTAHHNPDRFLGAPANLRSHGTFDKALESYYQSDDDFAEVVAWWNRFPEPEVVMSELELGIAHSLLPNVPMDVLRSIKTKCNGPCSCPRQTNALDLIQYCLDESFHGRDFLTRVLTETRPDRKISIMDSSHRSKNLPDSVVYVDDPKPIPCLACGEETHLYLQHVSLAHWWNG